MIQFSLKIGALCIAFTGLVASCTDSSESVKTLVQVVNTGKTVETTPTENFWQAPDIASIQDPELKKQVLYGKELIAHTSVYFGTKGKIAPISNGLNCQNCHLDAGTKPFGNNYGSVASMYPKFRARSGSTENMTKRISDCFERSLNGQAPDSTGEEMVAMKAYMNFLGSNVEKGTKALGSGLKKLAFLDCPVDPKKGKEVYVAQCQSCHQSDGKGLMAEAGNEYIYPPLWGKNSYNDAAGLNRITNFASYVKYNMPLGATCEKPILTDEEAWDVAAYVNSQFRPHLETPNDWPNLSQKPIDHPYGPYADGFSVKQHKYGPYQPIADSRK